MYSAGNLNIHMYRDVKAIILKVFVNMGGVTATYMTYKKEYMFSPNFLVSN